MNNKKTKWILAGSLVTVGALGTILGWGVLGQANEHTPKVTSDALPCADFGEMLVCLDGTQGPFLRCTQYPPKVVICSSRNQP